MRNTLVFTVMVLGFTQIFAWGSTYYLLAVLSTPIAADIGLSIGWIVSGLSVGLMMAGLVSPYVGQQIAFRGGRPVLALSSVIIGFGLLLLSYTTSLEIYLISWLIIGIGMGAGLYDPAFSTLGRLYGQNGRIAINALTLFGGFASTLCWPLAAYLEYHFGWRWTCFIFASFQIVVSLPIYLLGLPNEIPKHSNNISASNIPEKIIVGSERKYHWGIFAILSFTISLASFISTIMSVYLLTILQDKGLTFYQAVSLGALIGPCQVLARAIEMVIAKYHQPIWTKLVSALSVALGLIILWLGEIDVTFAIIFYGAGIGLESIARGTLPLSIYGADRYPIIMGHLAMPSLIAQASAPALASLMITSYGMNLTLIILLFSAIINIVLVVVLFIQLAFFKLHNPRYRIN